MPFYLLIGAGFSRNWGGWLADEAFEYLLGCPEVHGSRVLRESLWRQRELGNGFESALGEAQTAYRRNLAGHGADLRAIQDAVVRMFDDMNKSFREIGHLDFTEQNQALASGGKGITQFLARFDAIFSLNQDTLLERAYFSEVAAYSGNRWAGASLPGMERARSSTSIPADSHWHQLSVESVDAPSGDQPIYKLHGSSNWYDPTGDRVLVIGDGKEQAIRGQSILHRYLDIFSQRLREPGARLMIIGYGFRDGHINEIIQEATGQGLRFFIVCPEGAGAAMNLSKTRGAAISAASDLETCFKEGLIGASRRQLRETFGGDAAEFDKVMRFFGK